MPTVCIDWDDTLVGYKKHTPGWLPGAQDALRQLKRSGYTVVIHSCRANWPEGLAEIKQTLSDAGFRLGSKLKIHTEPGKPLGVAYVDDRAHPFRGDWADALSQLFGDSLLEDWKGRQARARDARKAYEAALPRNADGIVVY